MSRLAWSNDIKLSKMSYLKLGKSQIDSVIQRQILNPVAGVAQCWNIEVTDVAMKILGLRISDYNSCHDELDLTVQDSKANECPILESMAYIAGNGHCN